MLKCRQTDSIGSDGVRWPRPDSIGLHRKSVRERLGKYSSRYSSGCGGVLNCRQTDFIGSDGVRWPRPESIGHHRKSVRERLSKYSSRYSSGCGGVLNVGKRTPSDPMESVGRDQTLSDIIASQFARNLVNIH